MTRQYNHRWSPSHWRSGDNQSVGSSTPVVSRWLWPGNRTFLEVVSMVVSWWIAAFLPSHIFSSVTPYFSKTFYIHQYTRTIYVDQPLHVHLFVWSQLLLVLAKFGWGTWRWSGQPFTHIAEASILAIFFVVACYYSKVVVYYPIAFSIEGSRRAYGTLWTVSQALPNLHTRLRHAQGVVGYVCVLNPQHEPQSAIKHDQIHHLP